MKQPERRKSEAITQEAIERYATWEAGAAAAVLCERYKTIIKTKTALFTEMGILLMEIERRELWKFDVCPILDEPEYHSFNDWVKRASGTSNGTAYDALEAAKALSHIPAEERAEIPRVNQKVLAKLSPAVSGEPSVRKAAKEGSNDELRAKIERDHADQHLERLAPMRFSPEKSARKVIDHALEIAMLLDEAAGRDDALEKVSQFYIDEHEVEYNQTLRQVKPGSRSAAVN